MLEENKPMSGLEENVGLKKPKKISKYKILGISAACFVFGVIISSKVFGVSSEDIEKNTANIKAKYEKELQSLKDNNAAVIGQIKAESQKNIEALKPYRNLVFAYSQAISKKDALYAIEQKIQFVQNNAARIKENYISSNPDVKNLDANVVNQLLEVVNQNANTELESLKRAKAILSETSAQKEAPATPQPKNLQPQNTDGFDFGKE
ncbi:hypothetical protein BKH46_08070 [Helicobacter sp. 12S02634-8]|uniref:hypothetical protein n=1 Tax=Helicobacter sp. 12S02634-8 TaxID=1476199 RepID=UPI000BA74F27|nr:hypothetical protein [Helicobacter sp. 12S02634-8]PAF46333.1 hypothetical protein BKH46_08070 [Helicobacter sp. 12S02634-8]